VPERVLAASSASSPAAVWGGEYELASLPLGSAGTETAQTPLRLLVEPAQEPALQEDTPEPEAVTLADPGPVLRGLVVFAAELREQESVVWVEYQACPSGSYDWQVLARSEAAPFQAVVDTSTLHDGDYDLRSFVGRREGQIEGSRALRGRAFANELVTLVLRQPQPGARVAGTVALEAQVSPPSAEIGSLRFEFSSDGEYWRPMLRASRTGSGTGVWYTSGLPDGDYVVRAVASVTAGACATSEAVEIHLANR